MKICGFLLFLTYSFYFNNLTRKYKYLLKSHTLDISSVFHGKTLKIDCYLCLGFNIGRFLNILMTKMEILLIFNDLKNRYFKTF